MNATTTHMTTEQNGEHRKCQSQCCLVWRAPIYAVQSTAILTCAVARFAVRPTYAYLWSKVPIPYCGWQLLAPNGCHRMKMECQSVRNRIPPTLITRASTARWRTVPPPRPFGINTGTSQYTKSRILSILSILSIL